MKKILISLSLCLAMLLSTLTGVNAFESNDLDRAYFKVVEYYKGLEALESPDEIIAVENLGLEAENYELPDLETQDFENLTLGDLSKSIMALTLIDKDPTNINGRNLVELLESYVDEDGSIKGSDGSTTDIWVLFALESVFSNKVGIVADKLSTNTNDDGGFWYEYQGKFSSPDITGWGIEALVNADSSKYQKTIDGALAYLESTQVKEGENAGGYDFTPNGDTQSCVLEGLFVYNRDLVLNGAYNQAGHNPCETLLKFQSEDGSFLSMVYDQITWLPTGEMKFNPYTTMEGARCLGTYKNGSFVKRVQANFTRLQGYKELQDGDCLEIEATDGIVDQSLLASIQGKDIELKVKFNGYTWVINGKDVSDAKRTDLNVVFNTNAIDAIKLKEIAKGNQTFQFATNTVGNLGFKATLEFSVNKANVKMKLYDQDLKEISEVKSNDKGNVAIQLTNGANYVLVFQDETFKAVQTSDQASLFGYSVLLLGSLLVMKKVVKKKGLA